MTKKAIIIGAGPAGLTAAYELAKQTSIHPIVLEENTYIGGIACTFNHKGNMIDIGGHRFLSTNEKVLQWWLSFLPLHGEPTKEKTFHDIEKQADVNDPETTDKVMLVRKRVSHIFYIGKFFDYPISLKLKTLINLGLWRTLKVAVGYVYSIFFRRKEKNLKDFIINRFGKPLYGMFFENYTEKVWGVHPAKISASWGPQRINGLSLSKAVLNYLRPFSNVKDMTTKNVEKSLTEQFYYPKYGAGQLWQTVTDELRKMGGEIRFHHKVVGIETYQNKVTAVIAEFKGDKIKFEGDYVFSCMPVKDLIASLSGITIPVNVKAAAKELPYRDFITVGLLVNKLKIKRKKGSHPRNELIPDCWIYIQEPEVKIGRLQIFNNWSPYMVRNPEHTVWLGLEYFCNENDGLWNMSDEKFIDFAVKELENIGLIDNTDVLDSVRIKVKKAYPSYFGSYSRFDSIKDFLNKIDNLYCIGRNGQHRYNNMDHSMLTAFEAVQIVKENRSDKKNLWEVDVEEKD